MNNCLAFLDERKNVNRLNEIRHKPWKGSCQWTFDKVHNHTLDSCALPHNRLTVSICRIDVFKMVKAIRWRKFHEWMLKKRFEKLFFFFEMDEHRAGLHFNYWRAGFFKVWYYVVISFDCPVNVAFIECHNFGGIVVKATKTGCAISSPLLCIMW